MPSSPTVDRLSETVRLDRAGGDVEVAGAWHPCTGEAGETAELAVFLYMALHARNDAIFQPDSVLPDAEFERRIHEEVGGAEVLVPVDPPSPGAPAQPEGSRLVELHRVRISVPSERLDRVDGADGPALPLPCLRPNLSPGFVMYVNDPTTPPSVPTVRYYIRHEDPDTALRDWATAIDSLVARGLRFRTKMLSRRAAFPRNDAIVFYAADDADAVGETLTEMGVGRPTADRAELASPFCTVIGGGVARAEDPVDPRPGFRDRSFGEHRCLVLAHAVQAAMRSGRALAVALTEECRRGHVDPDDLSRNLAQARTGGDPR